MRILLLGKDGQLGWELQRALAPLGELIALGRAGDTAQAPMGLPGSSVGSVSTPLVGDLCDLTGLQQTVEALQPQVIVNAAAYTAVDRAESEPDLARRINAEAVAVLAQAAARAGCLLVHYSTDYVFDGQGERPWREDDATAPLSVYGQTKREGEQAIAASGVAHLLLRTSWVFGRRGGNFARTMLRLARERDTLRVIADQWGAPTGADLLADVSAHAIHQALRLGPTRVSGTYHVAAAGVTNWHGYAQRVLARAQALGATLQAGPGQVQAITTADYPTPARRPHNSRLDTQRLQGTFGLQLPPWEAGVDRLIADIL